jgi:hypothetical protein
MVYVTVAYWQQKSILATAGFPQRHQTRKNAPPVTIVLSIE